MKFDPTALLVNLAIFLLAGIGGGFTSGSAGIGIAALLTGVLNLPLAIIFYIAKKRNSANTCWVLMAVWILIGFSVCSTTRMNFH